MLATRLASLTAAVVVALLSVSAPAHAQTRTACYVPASGSVYIINEPGTPTKCFSPKHVEFTWSTSGAQGPQGPQGPAGPTGPQGPAGTPGGLSGLEFNSQAFLNTAPNGPTANYSIVNVGCSTNTKSVIAAGYSPVPGQPLTVIDSRPAIGTNGTWRWGFTTSVGSNLVVYWTCADGYNSTTISH